MKKSILTVSLLFFSKCLFAQSDQQVDNWLYGLPIKKSPKVIKKAILEKDNFQEEHTGRFNSNYANSTYYGKILKSILPKSGSLDSSKIYLAVGTLTMPDGYSGNMKWIRFEYFSADTLFLNGLFDIACTQLAETSIEHKPTGHRTKNNEAVGKGINFVYVNDSNRYRSISASRVRYLSGKQSFTINYSGSDD